jgi:hypothetical protein
MSARHVILAVVLASACEASTPFRDPIYRETIIRHARPRAVSEKFDPQESDQKLRDVFAVADAAAERRVANVKRDDRFIFAFWAAKKAILRDKYHVDWKTPAELNPGIAYYSYGQRRITPHETSDITAVIRERTSRHITVIERDPQGKVRVWLSPEGNEAMTYIVEKRGNTWKIVTADKAVFD